jgi:predicted nucleic acid-binding protein
VTYLLDTNAISGLMRGDPHIEHWMSTLFPADRVVTCAVVRGEILFGIARVPVGKRRTELQQTGHRFLDTFYCEPIPESAGDYYATVKQSRQTRGLTLDENDLWIAATALALSAALVTRDQDFNGIDGLPIVSPR